MHADDLIEYFIIERENENGKVWQAALDTVRPKKNIKTKPINDNDKICLIIGLYQLAIVIIRQKKY